MGWEYHNRRRDQRGRWGYDGKRAQLHIRCTDTQIDQIRARATARMMDVSEYVLDLIQRDMLHKYQQQENPPGD